jgi:hypothetical protein
MQIGSIMRQAGGGRNGRGKIADRVHRGIP